MQITKDSCDDSCILAQHNLTVPFVGGMGPTMVRGSRVIRVQDEHWASDKRTGRRLAFLPLLNRSGSVSC